MALPKAFFDHENTELYEKIFSNVTVFDAHTHMGRDKDGHVLDERTYIRNMKAARVDRAIVFPLNEANHRNFAKPNERILQFANKHKDRLVPFFRINPKISWEKEFDKCVSSGFGGLKLHPHSQKFGIADYCVMDVYEKCQEYDIPTLIHTGYGMTNISDDLKFIAKTFPKLKMIIGHSAFLDFDESFKKVGRHQNFLWDTSTVSMLTLMNMIEKIDAKRVVYGSDVPYYDFDISLQMVVDISIMCNKSPTEIKGILGGNISRWFP